MALFKLHSDRCQGFTLGLHYCLHIQLLLETRWLLLGSHESIMTFINNFTYIIDSCIHLNWIVAGIQIFQIHFILWTVFLGVILQGLSGGNCYLWALVPPMVSSSPLRSGLLPLFAFIFMTTIDQIEKNVACNVAFLFQLNIVKGLSYNQQYSMGTNSYRNLLYFIWIQLNNIQ